MATIYQQGPGPWICDDTAIPCDGLVSPLSHLPTVDGVGTSGEPLRPRRIKTDYRVEVGWLTTMRPRQGR